MTYRSWHLITIRSVATSWAFAAEIISMINTAMSFGARLVGAKINLQNTKKQMQKKLLVGHKSKHIVAESSRNRDRNQNRDREALKLHYVFKNVFAQDSYLKDTPQNPYVYAIPFSIMCVLVSVCVCLQKREFRSQQIKSIPIHVCRQLPAGWGRSTFSSNSQNCRGICSQYKNIDYLWD